MKKILYFVGVCFVAFFSNLCSKAIYGEERMGNTFYGSVMDRTPVTVFFFLSFMTILSGIFSFKNRGRALITFKENRKEVTKLCKIIYSDKKDVVFKDKEKVYLCPRTDIISIRKKNAAKIIFIILFILFALFIWLLA